MNKFFLVFIVLTALSGGILAQQVKLKTGMVITSSIVIKNGTYFLQGYDSLDRQVVLIKGNNIIVDFNNSLLKGNDVKQRPDEFKGIAIRIVEGHNITIKNLKAKGYKIAIYAENTEGLKIDNCDFSYNYRERLKSTKEKEDEADWLSYHDNEKDEWLRYGAAIYLKGCLNAVVSNNKVRGGQNGLLMVECNNCIIYNNNFSFNSGVGLGLYRSSNNRVLYNKMDFNIRGYSDGIYSRGQDSSGILVYEQSNGNLFYKNSATHGGDGFFLWAGQRTMDNGKGGCNDNILKDNDFSYAAANGIETTFSRNVIIHNRIFGCLNGIWAGYSFHTKITQNQFRFNKVGIAIEHGQHNAIDHNLFYGDREAIKIWANKEDTTEWNYPKYKNTSSVNYILAGNSFNKDSIALHILNSDSVRIFDNRCTDCLYLLEQDSLTTNIDTTPDQELNYLLSAEIKVDTPIIEKPINPFKGNGQYAGRNNIIMTEWGPYDFAYPLISENIKPDTSNQIELRVLGPKGKWRIIRSNGINAESVSGTVPGLIKALKVNGIRNGIEVIAEFTGNSFTDAFGNIVVKPKKYLIYFSKKNR